jgi:hypothetical protein
MQIIFQQAANQQNYEIIFLRLAGSSNYAVLIICWSFPLFWVAD